MLTWFRRFKWSEIISKDWSSHRLLDEHVGWDTYREKYKLTTKIFRNSKNRISYEIGGKMGNYENKSEIKSWWINEMVINLRDNVRWWTKLQNSNNNAKKYSVYVSKCQWKMYKSIYSKNNYALTTIYF